MVNFPSIKKNEDFRTVYARGKSLANRLFVMYVMPNDSESTRLGVSVSKKIGNSIIRHRITRLLREAFRLNSDRLTQGIDIVVVVRDREASESYGTAEEAFLSLCRRHGLLI